MDVRHIAYPYFFWLVWCLAALLTNAANAQTYTMCSAGNGTIQTATDESGKLLDPGGTGDYPANYACGFFIQPVSGGEITLTFNSFEVLGFSTFFGDYLDVYEGTAGSLTYLGTLNNLFGGFPADIVVPSGSMYLEFVSNGFFQGAGFDADWTTAGGNPGPGNNCEAVFSNGVQSHDASGQITLNQNNTISGGDEFLDTTSLQILGTGTTCNGSTCQASGSAGHQANVSFPAFPATNGNQNISGTVSLGAGDYGDITVTSNNATLRLTDAGSVYTMVSLTGNNNGLTLELSPGDYYINGDLSLNGNGMTVNLLSAGTVRIFTGGNVTLGGNMVAPDFTSSPMLIYSGGTLTMGNNNELRGFLYAEGTVQLQNNVDMQGGVSGASVNLSNGVTINYNPTGLANGDWGDFCDAPVTLPDPIAEYRMEDGNWNGTAGEVQDSSASGLHGTAQSFSGFPTVENSSSAITGDPGTCEYGQFNGVNDGYLHIADPGINSILDLADTFSISVWIHPLSWPSSDLTTILSKDENYEFHLNTSGRIFWWWGGGVRQLTGASSIPLNEWRHVTITYEDGNQVIYVDGVSDATTNATGQATTNEDDLHIGFDVAHLNRRFDGLIDEVRIYDEVLSTAQVNAVMNETRPCSSGGGGVLSYFEVNAANTASTCLAHPVTITAYDVNDNVVTDYSGSIDISTSLGSSDPPNPDPAAHGDWSVNSADGVLSGETGDDGTATYAFDLMDSGEIVLDLSNDHAETLYVTVEDSSAGVSNSSESITFSRNAFIITTADTLGDDIIAVRDHGFQIEMIREDDDTGSCGVATNYNVNDVKAWVQRDPDDPGGAGPQIGGVGLPDSEPGSENVSLNFNSGTASFSLSTSDIGRYSLEFLDDSNSFSDQDITGSFSTFTVRPFGYSVVAVGNPAAANVSGSVFIGAGEDFEVQVTAVGWTAGTDSDNNGIPDGHDDTNPANTLSLASNPVLTSFGQEGTGESVTIGSQLFLPNAGQDPGLETSETGANVISSFSNGVGTSSNDGGSTGRLSFAEVGIIELDVVITDGDYFQSGNTRTTNSVSRSGYVGRFTPSYLQVTSTTLIPACGAGFSYMGERFTLEVDLQARDFLDNVTQNYNDTSGFAKFDLSTAVGSYSLGAVDDSTDTPLSSRITPDSTSHTWTSGTGEFITDLVIERNSALDGPYSSAQVGVLPTDSDGVTVLNSELNSAAGIDTDNSSSNDHMLVGQQILRFGRLVLDGAHGPETASLPVNFAVEFWDGSTWGVTVGDNNCSEIEMTAINYPDGDLSNDSNRSVTIGSGSTTGIYGDFTAGDVLRFISGDAEHFFTAPGAGNTGSFDVSVDLTNYPWLRFDWNGDGDFNNEDFLPATTYTFGRYRGHDRIIYWQETY